MLGAADSVTRISTGSVTIGLLTSVPVSGLVQDGIAHILGLEVLRHGTSWANTISILEQGALANRGGTKGGATSSISYIPAAAIELSGGYVHVMRDSGFGAAMGRQNRSIAGSFVKRVNAKGYTMYAAVSTQRALMWIPPGIEQIKQRGIRLAIFILHIPCPTLRFMYKLEEIPQIFEADPVHGDAAYRTRQNLSPDRIGIVGAFRHGCDGKIIERLRKDPTKVFIGIAQLTAGIALTILGLGFVF